MPHSNCTPVAGEHLELLRLQQSLRAENLKVSSRVYHINARGRLVAIVTSSACQYTSIRNSSSACRRHCNSQHCLRLLALRRVVSRAIFVACATHERQTRTNTQTAAPDHGCRLLRKNMIEKISGRYIPQKPTASRTTVRQFTSGRRKTTVPIQRGNHVIMLQYTRSCCRRTRII